MRGLSSSSHARATVDGQTGVMSWFWKGLVVLLLALLGGMIGRPLATLRTMLRMIEETNGLTKRIGIEVQIETALGLLNLREIASCDDRIEDLILGPADMSASLGLPTVTAGEPIPGYETLDHFHYVLTHINIAARANNLQAIGGPYLLIRDLEGFRAAAMRERALGYDGKWALHPDQIAICNEMFAPSQEQFDKANHVLEAYREATHGEERKGAVMFGDEMIDEASRKMAAVHAALEAPLAGQRVAVIGCGPIGLMAIAVARMAGAVFIGVSDVSAPRLALARRMGADLVLDARTDDVAARLAAGERPSRGASPSRWAAAGPCRARTTTSRTATGARTRAAR